MVKQPAAAAAPHTAVHRVPQVPGDPVEDQRQAGPNALPVRTRRTRGSSRDEHAFTDTGHCPHSYVDGSGLAAQSSPMEQAAAVRDAAAQLCDASRSMRAESRRGVDRSRALPGAWKSSCRSAAAPPTDHAGYQSLAKRQVSGREPSFGHPQDRPPELDQLTARESEVLHILARGMSNVAIAAALVVGDATIKTHVARILMKLGLRDRIQAVIYAYEHGLVRPGEQPEPPSPGRASKHRRAAGARRAPGPSERSPAPVRRGPAGVLAAIQDDDVGTGRRR